MTALKILAAVAALLAINVLVAQNDRVSRFPNRHVLPDSGLVGLWTFGPDKAVETTTPGRWSGPKRNILRQTHWPSGLASWTTNGGTITTGQSDPLGSTDAIKVEATGPSHGIYQYNDTANASYTWSMWLRGNAGGEQVRIGDDSPGGAGTTLVNLTTSWQRFNYTGTPSAGNRAFLVFSNASSTFFAAFPILCPGPNPCDYEKVTDAQSYYDWSGSGNHATRGSSSSSDTNDPGWAVESGKVVGGSFDGVDDFSKTSATITLPTFLTVITVSKDTGAPMFVEHSVDANVNSGFYFHGGTNFSMKISRSGEHSINASPDWTSTSWMCRAGTYNGTFKLYVDGVATGTTGEAGSARANTDITDTVYIGSRAGSAVFHNGSTALVAIYNRVLTAGEIRRTYELIRRRLSAERGISLPALASWQPEPREYYASLLAPFALLWGGADIPTWTVPK